MRLIDANELIKDRVNNDLVVIAVKCTPTAYDVEKVVEQLEDKIEITWSHDYLGGRKDAFNEAIEIVKGGGVDE